VRPDPNAAGGPITLVGEGANLGQPKTLTLVKLSQPATLITTNAFSNATDTSFDATFKVTDLLHGVYDAKFVNEVGQTRVSRAVHIKSPHPDYKDGQAATKSTRGGGPGAQAK
jgi:hypothetical protein